MSYQVLELKYTAWQQYNIVQFQFFNSTIPGCLCQLTDILVLYQFNKLMKLVLDQDFNLTTT